MRNLFSTRAIQTTTAFLYTAPATPEVASSGPHPQTHGDSLRSDPASSALQQGLRVPITNFLRNNVWAVSGTGLLFVGVCAAALTTSVPVLSLSLLAGAGVSFIVGLAINLHCRTDDSPHRLRKFSAETRVAIRKARTHLQMTKIWENVTKLETTFDKAQLGREYMELQTLITNRFASDIPQGNAASQETETLKAKLGIKEFGAWVKKNSGALLLLRGRNEALRRELRKHLEESKLLNDEQEDDLLTILTDHLNKGDDFETKINAIIKVM